MRVNFSLLVVIELVAVARLGLAQQFDQLFARSDGELESDLAVLVDVTNGLGDTIVCFVLFFSRFLLVSKHNEVLIVDVVQALVQQQFDGDFGGNQLGLQNSRELVSNVERIDNLDVTLAKVSR